MNPKLEFCGSFLEITDFVYDKRAAEAGWEDDCSFGIAVQSGRFSGYADCSCSYRAVQAFIAELEELAADLYRGTVTWQEVWNGSTVTFSGDGCGHITVSGVLAEDRTDSAHSLKFRFLTDQTVYPQFIRALKSL